MIYTKQDALVSLRPKASYTWVGNDYSGLEWLGSGSAPTDAEITAELNRLNAAEPERLLREKRDELLTETDWVVTKATETELLYQMLGKHIVRHFVIYLQVLLQRLIVLIT